MTAPAWSLNRQAAKAVVLNARNVDDARLLLDVLGLVDGPEGREVLPDDRRGLDLELLRACPGEPPAEDDSAARARRRPSNTTPAGLLNAATPAAGQPATTRRSTPSPRPPIVEEPTVQEPAAAPPPAIAEPERRRPGRQREPIKHGSNGGFQAHKRHGVPIPDDDSCGCRAARNESQAKYQQAARDRRAKTPTEKGASSAASAAPGTAPEPASGHGYAGPDAQPQVSPSRSHTGKDGGPGASDAPAGPPVARPAPTAMPRQRTTPELPPIAHGTIQGWLQHHDRGALPPCEECTAAGEGVSSSVRADADDRDPQPTTDTTVVPSVAISRDLAEWLTEASTSPTRAIRRSASAAAILLEQLLDALDELARAERTRDLQPAGAEA